MADGADVIKEMLVKLGFVVDESAANRFTSAIAKATVEVAKFVVGIEAAAVGAVAAVGRISNEMDKLYFSALRSGGTADGILGLGYAFSQVGLSAGQARQTIEAMAMALRSNPGLQGLLRGLGVDTNQPTEQVVKQFVARSGNLPFYAQKQYAEMFGIDPQVLLAMRRGLQGYADEYHGFAEKIGVDSTKAAEAGNYFMGQFRALGAVFDLLQQKVAQTLGRRIGDDIARFRSFLVDNAGLITSGIERVASIIVFLGDTIMRAMTRTEQIVEDVIHWWQSLDTSSKRVIEGLGLLVIAWRALNIAFAMSPIGLIITALEALGVAILLLYDDYKTFAQYGRQYSLLDWDKIIPSLQAVWHWVTQVGIAIRDYLLAYWGALRDGAIDIAGGLNDIAKALGLSIPAWQGFSNVLGTVTTALANLSLYVVKVVLQDIADILHLIADLLRGDWSAAWRDAVKFASDQLADLKALFTIVMDALPDAATTALKRFAGVFVDAFGEIKKVAQETFDWIKDHLPSFKGNGGQAPPGGAYDVPGFTPSAYQGGSIGSMVHNAAYTTGRYVSATLDDVVELLRHIMQTLDDAMQQNGGEAQPSGAGGLVQNASFSMPTQGAGVAVAGLRGGGNITASIQERANYIIDQAGKVLGLTPAQAAGVAGRFMSESRLDPNAFNDKGGGHGAFGLAQWRGARQEALAGFMQEHPGLSSFQAQVQFALRELAEKFPAVLDMLRRQRTPSGANESMYGYEGGEPWTRNLGGWDAERLFRGYQPSPTGGTGGSAGDRVLNQNVNSQITINGSSDARESAREIERAQERVNANALRNLGTRFA